MTITVYKVVREQRWDGCSRYGSFSFGPQRSVVYEIGRTTTSKIEGTPLMAFDSILSARKFKYLYVEGEYSQSFPIMVCTAKLTERQDYRLSNSALIHTEDIVRYWKEEYTKEYTIRVPFYLSVPPPNGTVFCESITPIRFVSETEGR